MALRIVLALVGLYDAVYLAIWFRGMTSPRFDDFFALWSFGRYALSEPVARIYDPVRLQHFQQQLDPAFTAAYPFLYPPSILPLTVLFAFLPLTAAWVVWTLSGLFLSVSAALGTRLRSVAAAALLVAPTTLISVVAGQSGLFSAAAMLGGLRLLPTRPWLGGCLLGLLTVKPQLGLMLPVALVAARQWRPFAAAALTALAVAALSAALFGWNVWTAWLEAIPHLGRLVAVNQADVARIMPTVTAGLRQLGAGSTAAAGVQAAVALAAAVFVWRSCQRGIGVDALAVVVLGTFLATPFAYIYDMPMVTGALVLLWQAGGHDTRTLLLFAAIGVVPLVIFGTPMPLVVPALLAVAIIALARRARAAAP